MTKVLLLLQIVGIFCCCFVIYFFLMFRSRIPISIAAVEIFLKYIQKHFVLSLVSERFSITEVASKVLFTNDQNSLSDSHWKSTCYC